MAQTPSSSSQLLTPPTSPRTSSSSSSFSSLTRSSSSTTLSTSSLSSPSDLYPIFASTSSPPSRGSTPERQLWDRTPTTASASVDLLLDESGDPIVRNLPFRRWSVAERYDKKVVRREYRTDAIPVDRLIDIRNNDEPIFDVQFVIRFRHRGDHKFVEYEKPITRLRTLFARYYREWAESVVPRDEQQAVVREYHREQTPPDTTTQEDSSLTSSSSSHSLIDEFEDVGFTPTIDSILRYVSRQHFRAESERYGEYDEQMARQIPFPLIYFAARLSGLVHATNPRSVAIVTQYAAGDLVTPSVIPQVESEEFIGFENASNVEVEVTDIDFRYSHNFPTDADWIKAFVRARIQLGFEQDYPAEYLAPTEGKVRELHWEDLPESMRELLHVNIVLESASLGLRYNFRPSNRPTVLTPMRG